MTHRQSNLWGDDSHSNNTADLPLAAKMRPTTLTEVVGQEHLTAKGCQLHRLVKEQRLTSLLLWGPPGSGKTTLASILAKSSGMFFEQLSAVMSGVSDVRRIFDEAKARRYDGVRTCLFVDEIHRFSKSQQDNFLPKVEEGEVILIGATTENPSFALRAAMLSRMRVCVLKRLETTALLQLLTRAEGFIGRSLPLDANSRRLLCTLADGDGRYLLNMIEDMVLYEGKSLDEKALLSWVDRRRPIYDKEDEQHYDLISALHKSLRGSDVDAALYWCGRMLEGGDDPLYIARRLVRFAYEDIGMADPQASIQAYTAWETWQRLGSPEGNIAIMHAVIYLATAPKSNGVYKAEKQAMTLAKTMGSLMPPKHILNAPTKLMKQEGYGAGYRYDHDEPDGFSGQNYFPDGMERVQLYEPATRGFEREIKKRLDYWDRLRKQKGEFSKTRE